MASAISGYINQIANAVYGEQVRTAIINALEACYSDVENPDLQSAAFYEAILQAYDQGVLDIIEVTNVSQMTNQKIIYRYMGTETGYTANTLYFYNGTAWVPIGSGVRTAATAAQMTDTTAIYKYTGNEVGYTTNALYYYNGTKWTEISEAIKTDTTLTLPGVPADAQATGEALDILREDEKTDPSFSYSGRPADALATGERFNEIDAFLNEIEPYIDMIKEEIAAGKYDFDVSSLPDYWEDTVRDALIHVAALGDDYVHLIVTTDNHFMINYGKSTPIQQLMYDTGLFSKVINVGDITDAHTSEQVDSVIHDYEYFGDDLLFCIGNHDDYDVPTSALLPLIQNNDDLVGDVTNFNYYYDDDVNKIRYVVINTAEKYTSTEDALTNLHGGIEQLVAAPSGYHTILISHYPIFQFRYDYYGDDRYSSAALVNDQGLFGTVLSTGANFIGVISGHAHADSCVNKFDSGINQTVLINDGHAQDSSLYPKTEGTITENAITIISVNTARKIVKLYRVGRETAYGKSWQYSYKLNTQSRIMQNVFLKGDGIRDGDATQFAIFPAFETDTQLYLINKGTDEVYWEYRYNYTDGIFTSNTETTIVQPVFTKCKMMKLPKPSAPIDHYMVGFKTRNGTATAADFEVIENPNRYDMGYSLDEVPWFSDSSWDTNNYGGMRPVTSNGYKASDLINANGSRTYSFIVDDANFDATGLVIQARANDGTKLGDMLRGKKSGTFTTPSNCKYLTITAKTALDVADVTLE